MSDAKKQIGTWLVVIVLIGAAFGGGYLLAERMTEKTGVGKTGLTLVDAAGRKIVIPKTPERVISLQSGVTEILYAIGAGDAVVGVNKDGAYPSDYPPEVEKVENVGNMVSTNVEKVVALKPDIVFTWKYFINYASVLEEKGITVFAVDVKTMDDLFDIIRTIGLIMNKLPEAINLTQSMESKLTHISSKIKDLNETERVKVYYESCMGKTAGAGTWSDEFIRAAGGTNIYGNCPIKYPLPNYETIIQENPDVIVILTPNPSSIEDIKNREGWQNISAVKNNRIYELDYHLHAWGPRTVDGIEQCAKWFYPDLFT